MTEERLKAKLGVQAGLVGEPKESVLDNISTRIGDSIVRLETLVTNLDSLADRVYGARPEANDKVGIAVPCRSGMIGQLEDQADRVASLLCDVEEAANRLYNTA